MHVLKTLVALCFWAAMAYAVLLLGRLDLGHSACGPWGCGPATEALLAAHGFWLVTLAWLVAFAVRMLSPNQLRTLGMTMALGGLWGILAIGGWDLYHYLPRVAGESEKYIVQRVLYRIVTTVDLPVMELTLLGGCCWIVARVRKVRTQTAGDTAHSDNRTTAEDGSRPIAAS